MELDLEAEEVPKVYKMPDEKRDKLFDCLTSPRNI